MAWVDLQRLPPVLADLLTPWIDAVETAGSGLGGHVAAVAAHASSALRRRVVATPRLERAFADAHAATDALAVALDGGTLPPFWRRGAARDALIELTVWLRRAEPSETTRDLGIGW